jgi:hypothetical protein
LLEGPAGKKQSETAKKNKPKKNVKINFGGLVRRGGGGGGVRGWYSTQKFPGFVAGHWQSFNDWRVNDD